MLGRWSGCEVGGVVLEGALQRRTLLKYLVLLPLSSMYLRTDTRRVTFPNTRN